MRTASGVWPRKRAPAEFIRDTLGQASPIDAGGAAAADADTPASDFDWAVPMRRLGAAESIRLPSGRRSSRGT
ncbi:hypothetical protein GCM10010921_04180 [Microbacterium album]|uniref:Uncharacterized protein n=1 Tax=Microbacterium album TaxID=2053191 RepID=A0A917MMK7_9MICO|nr:hypothetical protein GCM10010921_04180 [Microbacterium album]